MMVYVIHDNLSACLANTAIRNKFDPPKRPCQPQFMNRSIRPATVHEDDPIHDPFAGSSCENEAGSPRRQYPVNTVTVDVDTARDVDVHSRVNRENFISAPTGLFGSDDEDDGEGPWTTVPSRRRTPSPTTRKHEKRSGQKQPAVATGPQTLDKELASVISEAEKSMTPAEKEIISRRSKKVRRSRRKSSSSREEGPSSKPSKGKAADLGNWDGVISDKEDINIESQIAAMNSFKRGNRKDLPPHLSVESRESEPRTSREPDARSSHRNSEAPTHAVLGKDAALAKKDVSKASKNALPSTVQAISQVPADSYVGMALKRLNKKTSKHRKSSSPSDSSPSSSPSSDSSDSSSESSDTTSSSSSDNRSRTSNFKPQNGQGRSNSKPSTERDGKRDYNTPRLSEKEKAERLANGQCFKCGGYGHIGRNCPDNNVVKASGSKPPGVSNFNVEIIPEEGQSDQSVEVLDSLPLGAIDFDNPPEPYRNIWATQDADWQTWQHVFPRKQMGMAPAMVIKDILTRMQPYPGDERYVDLVKEGFRIDKRFDVRPLSVYSPYVSQSNGQITTGHMIIDKLTDFRVKLWVTESDNPRFDLARWYAMRRNAHFNYPEYNRGQDWPSHAIGTPWATVARHLLTDGIIACYPTLDPDLHHEDRFWVSWGENEYTITDHDFESEVRIDRTMLESHSFDLVGWYCQKLSENGFYAERYWHSTESVLLELESNSPEPSEVGSITDLSDTEESSVFESSSWSEVSSQTDLDSDSSDDGPPPLEAVSDSESEADGSEYNGESDSENFDDQPSIPRVRNDSGNLSAHSANISSQPSIDDPDFLEEIDPIVSNANLTKGVVGDILGNKILRVLNHCAPFPGDTTHAMPTFAYQGRPRFEITRDEYDFYEIYDALLGFEVSIHAARLRYDMFSLGRWYAEACARQNGFDRPYLEAKNWLKGRDFADTIMGRVREDAAEAILEFGFRHDYPMEEYALELQQRFVVETPIRDQLNLKISDFKLQVVSTLPCKVFEDPDFNIVLC
ncbi:hypothetical protein CVT26_005294 [Gymnopilus dilepis]|uniref:CCHC-type domain-containing protein n=1 Tax=Gymnopilus dilepis TaxID=231916 RepID=A0A409YSZ7_9AGAR|nr:hypothetical protein CVT26_005294 [Gymnopilus dilepis]